MIRVKEQQVVGYRNRANYQGTVIKTLWDDDSVTYTTKWYLPSGWTETDYHDNQCPIIDIPQNEQKS